MCPKNPLTSATMYEGYANTILRKISVRERARGLNRKISSTNIKSELVLQALLSSLGPTGEASVPIEMQSTAWVASCQGYVGSICQGIQTKNCEAPERKWTQAIDMTVSGQIGCARKLRRK